MKHSSKLDKNTKRLQFDGNLSILDVLYQNQVDLPSHCGGRGTCGFCKIEIGHQNVNKPSPAELHLLSSEEIQQGKRLACQCYPYRDTEITLFEARQRHQFKSFNGLERPLKIGNQGHQSRPNKKQPGLCIDMGTTLIRFSLLDRSSHKRVMLFSCPNPQMRFGSDIVTRLTHAFDSENNAELLSSSMSQTISEALSYIDRAKKIPRAEINKVMIVGNTAMLSLFTGKNYKSLMYPEYWNKRIDCQPKDINPLKDKCGIPPGSSLDMVPPITGFIGSDLLSAVVSSNMISESSCSLLVDFGTNSEIALWTGDKLWITSAAGGPAFDGCGISCGMSAESGAVYAVETGVHKPFQIKTIDNAPAKGICGSGLLDAIAWFVQSGQIKKSGRMMNSNRLILNRNGREIAINKKDVDIFQRAKAAVASGISCLLNAADRKFEKIEKVIICGSFGQHISIRNAQFLGLLPEIPVERVVTMGNAALEGCEQLLLSSNWHEQTKKVLKKCAFVDLARTLQFENNYPYHLFLDSFSRNESMGGENV